LLCSLSIASAASAVGVINSIDTAKNMVTMDNGSSYSAPLTMKLSDLKVGEKVDLTYTSPTA